MFWSIIWGDIRAAAETAFSSVPVLHPVPFLILLHAQWVVTKCELTALPQNPARETLADRVMLLNLLKLEPMNYFPPLSFPLFISPRTALREDYDNHIVKSPGEFKIPRFSFILFNQELSVLFPSIDQKSLNSPKQNLCNLGECSQAIRLQLVSKVRKIGTCPSNNQLTGLQRVVNMAKFNILKTEVEPWFY